MSLLYALLKKILRTNLQNQKGTIRGDFVPQLHFNRVGNLLFVFRMNRSFFERKDQFTLEKEKIPRFALWVKSNESYLLS